MVTKIYYDIDEAVGSLTSALMDLLFPRFGMVTMETDVEELPTLV